MTLFTLGSGWVDQYISGMVLLNVLLGHPTATAPLRVPDTESVLLTLNEIARDNYQPVRYFQPGGRARPAFVLQPPDLVATETYAVLALNASTPQSRVVSVNTGGIIFEDPAWAVFAAYSLTRDPKRALPLAAGNQELWRRLSLLQAAIRDAKYSDDAFFGPVNGFIPPTSGPSFALMQVTGAQLTALRGRGVQSFGTPTPLRFYQLFLAPPRR